MVRLSNHGVYVAGPTSHAPPVFVAAAVPSRMHLLHLVATVARRGHLLTDTEGADEADELAEPVRDGIDDPAPDRDESGSDLPAVDAAFLVAKTPRSRRWRVFADGFRAMCAANRLREESFPDLHARPPDWRSSVLR